MFCQSLFGKLCFCWYICLITITWALAVYVVRYGSGRIVGRVPPRIKFALMLAAFKEIVSLSSMLALRAINDAS